MIVTIICPESLMSDANNLAAVLVTDSAAGPANLETFKSADWQDTQANLFAVSSAKVGPNFFAVAGTALVRPVWDSEQQVNMAGAVRAQTEFESGTIRALVGDDPLALLTQRGLSRVAEGA
jgi:hypothetical protein